MPTACAARSRSMPSWLERRSLIDVEQDRMQPCNRNAHRKHNPPADGSGQRRKDHQTRFMRAHEGP